MRISDWSSDVCSSDLIPDAGGGHRMIQAPDLPTWAAIIIALLVLGASLLTLVGALGLIRLPTFYARVHATTLGATAVMAALLLASMLCSSVLQTRPLVPEILISLFVTLTIFGRTSFRERAFQFVSILVVAY